MSDGSRLAAITSTPWLDIIGPRWDELSGRFVEIVYRASLLDEPVRPIFRFWSADGSKGLIFKDRIAPAPIVGAARWIGRVPPGTIRVEVSPTNRLGRFDFVIESIRRRLWVSLLAYGLPLNRRSTRSAIVTKLIRWHPESDVNLAWAIGATPLADFERWRAARVRAVDPDGLDAPRANWDALPPIRIVIADDKTVEAARTRASIEAQDYRRYAIVPASGQLADGADGSLTIRLRAGDRLLPGALAYAAEQARRYPGTRVFYGDTFERTRQGTIEPRLKPGWSPRLHRAQPYLVGAVFIRDIAALPNTDRLAYLETGELPMRAIDCLGSDGVKGLSRFILETDIAEKQVKPVTALPEAMATAAILIPTRDHPALLRRVVASIKAHSTSGTYQIVVIDNGSIEAETKSLLLALAADPDILVLDHPGPFNFSLICNEAAARSEGDVLVFLNDDTQILVDGWLERLVSHALQKDIGAIGAKLTYPDGRLQHIGVLLGMGESAGHFGALAPGDAKGWASRNEAVHEVSAVTGACLAVARAKFDAVGGFDAVHLPIELSDIDLCLKLNERGWQTIVDPDVHLMHEESVSRGGATLRRLAVHGSERSVFIERWHHKLRDDPTFHPGLSLYCWQAALG